MKGFKTRLKYNIDKVQIHQEAIETLVCQVLPNVVLLMMASSVIMIFTHSIIPKLIGLLGFIGFFLLNQHPDHRREVDPEGLR